MANMNFKGRVGIPVVMLMEDEKGRVTSSFYFDSIKKAADALITTKGLKSKPSGIITLISLSCQLPGRRVHGFKYRYATDEETVEYKKAKGI